jgi:transcription termination factor NusB
VVKAASRWQPTTCSTEDLAEQFGFTEDVIDRIKRQVKSEDRVVKLERRLAAEDRKRSAVEQETQTKAQFEAEVSKHLSELNGQWERIISANPEVAAMSDVERAQLRVELVEYARENDGVPLNVAFEALEARRLRDDRAKRAATAASRQKKASASRVTSRPSGTASSPAPRAKGDWDAAIAEAVAELEARKARN